MRGKYPTLSLSEKERRWRRTRNLMKHKDLDCLLVFGLKGRENYDSYLTNLFFNGIVVFPMGGEPVYLVWSASRIVRHLEGTLDGEVFWVNDIRLGVSGPSLVGVLREKGLDQARIGIVGLKTKGPGETEGIVPYTTWSHVLDKFPEANFLDLSLSFSELMLVKSEEELVLMRYSAEIGELACRAMIEATKPGVQETEIYATILKTIHSHGAIPSPEGLILKTGPDNVSWGGNPIWASRGGGSRVLQKGDMVMAEIFTRYGGLETQQQMALALKPVSSLNRYCADVARRSYEAGLSSLRPGATFKNVAETMEVPLTEAGCWHLTPLIHSLSPLVWVGPTYVGIDELPGIQNYKGIRTVPSWGDDLVIKPGMVFELEPNACKDKQRVNIGGTVVVTERGVQELNKLPTTMRLIGERPKR